MYFDLEQLLQEVFDRTTLRRFLGRFPESIDLCASLPGEAASWKLTAQRAAEDLTRRGYPGQPEFWQALLDAVPGRGPHIRAVMIRGWPNVALPIGRSPAVPPRRASPRWTLHLSILALAAALIAFMYDRIVPDTSPGWEVLAAATPRVPSLIVREDPGPLTLSLIRTHSEAELALDAQDVRGARFELIAAEEVARQLVREAPDEVNTANLASVLERRALVELRLGGVHNVRVLLREASSLRERALLDHRGGIASGAGLAAALRRNAVILVRIGDVAGASQSLGDATTVLRSLPPSKSTQDMLRAVDIMRSALPRLDTGPAGGNDEWDGLFVSAKLDHCLALLERGEEAFDVPDPLAAQDEFERFMADCTSSTLSGPGAGWEALGLVWLAATSCTIGLETEDPEIRHALLETANDLLEEFIATYRDGAFLAPRLAQSQERARFEAMDCRKRAALGHDVLVEFDVRSAH